MKKDLSKIDKVYGKLNKTATVGERLQYCVKLIQRTESYITKNREKLAAHIQSVSFEMIVAAETEIAKLSKHNTHY